MPSGNPGNVGGSAGAGAGGSGGTVQTADYGAFQTIATASGVLINGTPIVLAATLPNDGDIHPVMLVGRVNVTSAETGGGLNFTYTDSLPVAATITADAGGHAAGNFYINSDIIIIAPGPGVGGSGANAIPTLTVTQVALTGGAGTFYLALLAA
jgi:hypothetical protein